MNGDYCLRCGQPLFRDGEDKFCLFCGYRDGYY
ncbi:MAG TPA: hypothetical protein G4O09_08270 [Dehalococcoidia bacterium]|nr:hypothetical protein [Dehalococcoidia bacterium]